MTDIFLRDENLIKIDNRFNQYNTVNIKLMKSK